MGDTQECLFCKIIDGSVPSQKVYEDDTVLAFLDIHPINPGHTLVVPKQHVATMYEAPDEMLTQLMRAVKKVSVGVKNAVSADGISISQSNEPAAGQEIFHLHFHIIPRFKNDGHRPWKGTPYKEGEIESIAQTIKQAL